VEANPGFANEWDWNYDTPLFVAVDKFQHVPLILWLVNEKGADVNAAGNRNGLSLFHVASSCEVVKALLDCGTDPTLQEATNDDTPLISYLWYSKRDSYMVLCLLENPQVRATVNTRDRFSSTALHYACQPNE